MSDQEVLPAGLEAHPDLEWKPKGSSRPHIEAIERSSGRVVLRCNCDAEHVIKYRDVIDALMAKLMADPTLRRVDILTSEL